MYRPLLVTGAGVQAILARGLRQQEYPQKNPLTITYPLKDVELPNLQHDMDNIRRITKHNQQVTMIDANNNRWNMKPGHGTWYGGWPTRRGYLEVV